MEHAIEIQGLSKSYRGFELKDVSLTIPRGYIMGLIGPNGAGKTTIIKLIMNLTAKDAGQIRILGLDSIRDEARIKARIGFVYDEPGLYEDVSLKAIARAISPFYPRWDPDRFSSLMNEFQLPPGRKYRALSRGMRIKFALALALSHDADLIILDEPTSGLDPVFRRGLLDKLSAIIQDEKKSVLFSTHITTDLEHIADYITFVRHGELVFSLSKNEIMENWGIAKGGQELMQPEYRHLFCGFVRRAYGVEALTRNLTAVKKALGPGTAFEKASLDSIMVMLGKEDAK